MLFPTRHSVIWLIDASAECKWTKNVSVTAALRSLYKNSSSFTTTEKTGPCCWQMLRLSHTKMDGRAFTKIWWKYKAMSIRVWSLADVRHLYLVCFQTPLCSVRCSKDFQLIMIPSIRLERGTITNIILSDYVQLFLLMHSQVTILPLRLYSTYIFLRSCLLSSLPVSFPLNILGVNSSVWLFFFFGVCACVCLLSMFLSVVRRLLPSSLCSGCDCTNRCLLESSPVTSSACTNFLPVALGPVVEPPSPSPSPSLSLWTD